MKKTRPDIALRRVLDALEADLLNAPDAEIDAVVAETGMNTGALLSDTGAAFGLRSVRTDLYGADKNRNQSDGADDEIQSDSPKPSPRVHPH